MQCSHKIDNIKYFNERGIFIIMLIYSLKDLYNSNFIEEFFLDWNIVTVLCN